MFQVTLSHLKWNCVPGGNPCWTSHSNNSSANLEFNQWVRDWEQFGLPFTERIKNSNDVVAVYFDIKKYRKNSWVKSDGPQHYSFFETGIILLSEEMRHQEAMELFKLWVDDTEKSKEFLRPRSLEFIQRRIRKINDWLSLKQQA
ncbi:hypothetical protein QN395_11150 [Undibacterium sp. RTI2.2]|uniref:hypothetical protein n=1 Tax=unclassified Undibacterium TaxID=2630295 RepID=UPI002AB528DA|nr:MULTISPECIES: hypothetical protein [unclassified Undibacterium]MDY7540381.1 hypothetical protein [Undibacterium sp. 5I1]MEB0117047.1 hypothetical protein [Undibacterium sp. RTI2.2]MEB0230013.1 hypothetical protein [Undibacterium sp. 10I3]MEB0258033.1 hypothetical protein [Undibacterium sp. 5I1]